MRTMTVEEMMVKGEKCQLIDLRSQREFQQGTINHAINLPILDDTERAIVGTIYKQESKEKAKLTGIKHVSAKLEKLVEDVSLLAKSDKELVLFCSRGGYRSGPFVQLLNSLGVDSYQLVGGYKAYRHYVLDYFQYRMAIDHEFIVLHGNTGCGKTVVLKELSSRGIPVIDLEGLAQNSGSVFGFIGHSTENMTQKQFDSLLLHQLIHFRNQPVFIESESQRIGSVTIPKKMHQQMESGVHVLLDTSVENRVNQVVEDYCDASTEFHESLHKAINGLTKFLGHEHIKKLNQLLDQKSYRSIARDLIDNYYDPLYKHSIEKYSYDLKITYDTINEVVNRLSKYYLTIKTGFVGNEEQNNE